MFKANVGTVDRALRIVVGVALVAAATGQVGACGCGEAPRPIQQ